MEIDIPEMELDKGMSSDTAVGDVFELEMDSEDDERRGPTLFSA